MPAGNVRFFKYRPQLARSAPAAPSGDAWLHELSYGGERLGCSKRDGRVQIVTGSGEDVTERLGALASAIAALPASQLLIDGELSGSRYVAFDLLHLDGRDLGRLPLEARKERLGELLTECDGEAIQYAQHLLGDGPRVLRHACQLGAHGLVSKRRHERHRPGLGPDWVQTACRPDRARVQGVPISTPARVLYPALGFTKLELVELYADLARWILPHVRGRPLTLVRCEHGASKPDALRSECQFLRHASGWHRWVPSSVHREHIVEQKKRGEYLVIQTQADLLSILNGDILELHTWNATIDHLEQPDRWVFDLDPAGDVRWSELVAAARTLRAHLQKSGLASWVKTTGGKGLHVCVPLRPELDWDACFERARGVARELERAHPRLFTTTFGKAARSGKVLIDYKRNHRAAVAIAAFSTRARPAGPLSMPLTWKQLETETSADRWTVENVRGYLARLRRDPWHDYWRCHQRLT